MNSAGNIHGRDAGTPSEEVLTAETRRRGECKAEIGLLLGLCAFLTSTAPLQGAPGEGCGKCHAKEAQSFAKTSMAGALARGADAHILRSHAALTFADGMYKYTIRDGIYAVTDGTRTISAPAAWAFGLGAAGQTYVFERDGKWHESRVSYYQEIGELDLTLGARNVAPKSLDEAAGRQMTARDAANCFGCHSLGAPEGLPGVQCESCHAGASHHQTAVSAGDAKAASMPKLAALDAEEISELCGKCHRTWSDIASNGPRGVENVRFQGYRLTNSKCYNVSDRRISCVACHDPHAELDRRSASYDGKCAACHGKTVRACSTGKADCAGCHMPKFEIPGSHHRFTDHQIRIVRTNETYPN